MEKGYIYKTTNLVNNKIYIGKKKGEFNSDYFGSGFLLKRAINKHGKNNFKLEVIIYTEDKNKLNELEKQYIKKYRELFGKENLYNIADGGDGGDLISKHPNREEIIKKTSIASKGRKVTQEERENNSIAAKKRWSDINYRKKQHESMMLRMSNESMETRRNRIEASRLAHLGTKHSVETIEKMRKIKLGKKASKETRAKMSESAKIAGTGKWIRKKKEFSND